jgi:hypothetical protein
MKNLLGFLFMLSPIFVFSQAKEFAWLAGTWKIKNENTYEVWKTASDQKTMEGVSYQINGTDTLVTERIKIIGEKKAFYFVPDVAGDQPEINFKITRFDDTAFTAENPKHDFPKIIRYKIIPPNKLMAQIEGHGKMIPFDFQRVE